jgi:hypothetical protein
MLVLRRHLAKFHLCLSQEMNKDELPDDADTVLRIIEAVWDRYAELKGMYAVYLSSFLVILSFQTPSGTNKSMSSKPLIGFPLAWWVSLTCACS